MKKDQTEQKTRDTLTKTKWATLKENDTYRLSHNHTNNDLLYIWRVE